MAALLAVLLVLPALGLGLIGDDFVHQRLLGAPGTGPAAALETRHSGAPFGLFTFVDGDRAHVAALQATGQIAWWASPDLRLSFWRPVSELTHWVDARLWPDAPWLMHLQNLLWYGLLVALLLRLYRAIDPEPTRNGLSVLIFALSSLHVLAVAWIAARNQLLAGCCSLVALTAFHHWREGAGTRQAWLAALALGVGLLSAEAAISTLGYMAAHVIAFPQGTGPRNLARQLARKLWPYVLIVVTWRATYSHLGHGAVGSGAYLDPGASLPRFAHALALRLPSLLLAGLTGISSSLRLMLDPTKQALYAAAATAVAMMSLLVSRRVGVWSETAPSQGAQARFWGMGLLMSLIPLCAGESNDRQLLTGEFGLSALLALLFTQAITAHRAPSGKSFGLRAALSWTALLAAVHLLAMPVVALVSTAVMKRAMRPTTLDEPLSIDLKGAPPDTHVVLLNPSVAVYLYYYPDIRIRHGLPNAASTQALASGNQDLTLHTLDAHSFTLSGDPAKGLGFADAMSRDLVTRPFHVGDTVDIGGAEVTVLALTQEGSPNSARFRFKQALDDTHWRFMYFADQGYQMLHMPAPGQSIVLKQVDLAGLVRKAIRGA